MPSTDRFSTSGRHWATAVMVGALAIGACSSSDGDSTGSSAPATDVDVADTAFDPDFTENDGELIEPVVIGTDAIIATDDGAIPSTSTEPPPAAIDTPPTTQPTTTQPAPAAGATTTSSTTQPAIALPDPADVGRIVSLSSTHTETLFALGLGEFVVAVDQDSDFPAEAQAVRQSGLRADTADVAAVLAFNPDVVIVGDDPTGTVGRLTAAGVASYSGPPARSLDEVYGQIRAIAALVDRSDSADALIARMQAEITSIRGGLPNLGSGLTVFHEIDPSLITIGDESFLASIYGELGLANIGGPGGAGGTAQLSSDAVIAADPDVIVLADNECCGVTIDVVAGRSGWGSITAVERGAVVTISDDLASRWGPRVVELIRTVAGGVAALG